MSETKKRSLLDRALGKVRAGSAIVLGVPAIIGAIWWLIEWRVQDYIVKTVTPPATRQCVFIPPTGHYVEGAAPGEWALIEWRGIERRADCGAPELTAIIVNGDGIFHAVPLSITGVNLDLGLHPSMRYQFRIPDNAHPGRAWFRVTLDFHDAARTINSPRVHFRVLDPQPKTETDR